MDLVVCIGKQVNMCKREREQERESKREIGREEREREKKIMFPSMKIK